MAATRKVRVKKDWRGSSLSKEDDDRWRLSPGVITGPNAWNKLCQEWHIDAERAEVAFENEIILVAAGQGMLNHIVIRELTLDEAGDLKFGYGVTEIGCPGFVYHILIVERRGIKTINGKLLPED